MFRSVSSIVALAAISAFFGACTIREETKQVWEPYAGEPPYPNRRARLELPPGTVGVVSNSLGDTLSFLSLPDLRVVAEVPVGRDPIDIDGPHHLALNAAAGVLYTALSYPTPETAPGPHASHGGSTRFGFVQKLSLTDLSLLGEVRVAANPGDIVLSEDGARVVVTHFDRNRAQSGRTLDEKRAELMMIDTRTLVGEAPDPRSVRVCAAPHGVSLAGSRAYVACYGEDSLAIVDLDSPALDVEHIPLEGGSTQPGSPTLGPYSAVASPDGATLAVGCLDSKEVRLFDVAAKTFRPMSLGVSGAAFFGAWSSDGKTLFVPTQSPDAVQAFDATSGAKTQSHSFGEECVKPHEIARGEGGLLYVVCEGDHVKPGTVIALDAATLEVKAQTKVGVYPDRIAFMPGRPQ